MIDDSKNRHQLLNEMGCFKNCELLDWRAVDPSGGGCTCNEALRKFQRKIKSEILREAAKEYKGYPVDDCTLVVDCDNLIKMADDIEKRQTHD